MKHRKISPSFALVMFGFLGVLLLSVYSLKYNSTLSISQKSLLTDQSASLQRSVADTIHEKYENWNDKITIDSTNESHDALKGSWWMKDRWDWLAYKDNEQRWVTLVSFDGFDCSHVDRIPERYQDFFKDKIYMSGSKYCYDFK